MKIHKNSRLTPKGRELLVKRIVNDGIRIEEAAQASGVSVRTAYKWLARYRAQGREGLEDRSSRPARCPHRTSKEQRRTILKLRRERRTYREISQRTGVAHSTVGRIVKQAGLNRLSHLDPAVTLHMNLSEALAECRRAAREGYRVANNSLEGIRVTTEEALKDLKKTIADMDTKKVQITDVTKQIQEQLQHVVSELNSLYEKSYASLEEKRAKLDEFSITLFGRTMAGKSTLMEILTNGDGSSIGKGGQRTTRDIRHYSWKGKGLRVTDVPGIAAFEGAEDEEVAFKAAEQSDLVLFLITDDAPQPAEVECLARVRSLAKPVLGICNVKESLDDADDINLFLRDKWFDPQRLGALIRQFHEFTKKHTSDSQIPFIYTHLQSKFLSRKPKYKSQRRKLERTSRFDLVENQITSEVIGRGSFLRWKNFIDGATVPMLQFSDCLLDFSAKNSSNGRVLIDKRRRVASWAEQFQSNGQDVIDTFISKQMNFLRNEIPAFVEENYDKTDAGYRWKHLIESQNIEQKAKQLAEKLQGECKRKLLDIEQEVASELNLVGKLFDDRRISMDSIFDTKRAWNWVTNILSQGLAIASFFTGGAAMVASVAVSLFGRFLSRWIEDRESKARKQREELERQLQGDVDKKEKTLRKKFGDWFRQDLLKKQVYVLLEKLDAVNSIVLKLADTQRNFAWLLIKEQKHLHRILINRAFSQIGYEHGENIISNIARLPDQPLIILIEPDTAFPENIHRKLEELLGQEIRFAINTHNPMSILAQTIGCDEGKIRIESGIRIAHVPIDDLDAVSISRSKLAQQLTELHVMR